MSASGRRACCRGPVAVVLLAGLLAGGVGAAEPAAPMGLLMSTGVGKDGEAERVEVPVAQGAAQPATGAAPPPAGGSGYRIDAGDGISVNVFGEPDLGLKDERVKGDGTITLPLIGDIAVRGLTAQQVKDAIERRLRDGYLKKPSVTVAVETYRMFFIKGEVNKPGGYSYAEGLTVEKAVALAGGYTERATENEIKLVREDAPEKVLKVGPGTAIRPGDVVTIGESFF